MPEQLSGNELITALRGFAISYPEDVFPPLTDRERRALGGIADRCGAAMGRHLAPYMLAAANELESLRGMIERSGFDISDCGVCGDPVVCIPDGMPMCEACAKSDEGETDA